MPRVCPRIGFTARNGAEALKVIEREAGAVDLLVTDVVMPGMSGPDLAERIMKIRPQMKVLYTSGFTDEAIQQHGLVGDAMQFVGKPYTIEGLTSKVRELLESS